MNRFLFLVILILLPACFFSKNAEGRRSISFIPTATLHSQSSMAYDEQKKTIPLSKNKHHVAIVKRVADRLIKQAQQRYGDYCDGFEWEVQLFNEEAANAYCMPGGKIGIYSGILPVCVTEGALAAVMGHEIAHALLKHGNERVSQQLGISAIGYIINLNTQDKDYHQAIMIGVGLGSQFGVLLPYSRYHESEADRLGLRLMAWAGYDPSEAPNLWLRMKEAGGEQPPEFMSTHPSHDKRIDNLKALQDEVWPLYQQASPQYGLGDNF